MTAASTPLTDRGHRGRRKQENPVPEAIGQPCAEQPSDQACKRLRERREARSESRIAEDTLPIKGDDEHFARVPRSEQERDDVGGAERRQPGGAEMQGRIAVAQLPERIHDD
jgi:hypothetical protein